MKRPVEIIAIIVLIFALSGCAEEKAVEQVGEGLLILVNYTHPLPEGYSIELVELSNGERVDERIYPDLQQMFDDMRGQGLSPMVNSAYRSKEEQQAIIDEKYNGYIAAGYSPSEAQQLTYQEAAPVGCSEHESGLALDITAAEGDMWEVYGWLAENAWQYGFILRYALRITLSTLKNTEIPHFFKC